MNEFRENILKDCQVLIAPNRAKNYSVSVKERTLPDLKNPFLPGNEELTPQEIYSLKDENGWRTRVFPNKFSLVNLEASNESRNRNQEEVRGGFGAHEMIIDSRESEKHFFSFCSDDHKFLLTTIRDRIFSLHKDSRLQSSFVFKQQGILSGSVIPHSNTQITSFGFIYPELDKEIRISRRYYLEKQRSLFSDIVRNSRENALIIEENRDFIALVPYSARFEFEIWILPKEKGSNFAIIDDTKVKNLSKLTKEVCKRLEAALGEVALNWSLFTAPCVFDHKEQDYFHHIQEHYRWHIEIVPRIKPISGFTTGTGFYINSVTPEESAEYLKKI